MPAHHAPASSAWSRYALIARHDSWFSVDIPASGRQVGTNTAVKVDPRLVPTTAARSSRKGRASPRSRRRKAAEEFQVDNLCKVWFDLANSSSASLMRVSSCHPPRVVDDSGSRSNLELAAALVSMPAADMVDNQPPHNACGIIHKSRAVRERGIASRRHIEVGLMQKRGRTQAHSRTPAREFPRASRCNSEYNAEKSGSATELSPRSAASIRAEIVACILAPART